jgi:hypothetical protein
MNKNFKKVLDLIAEMKQSFATASMKFEQATLMDGTIVEFEIFEVGQPLFVVTETETIPAPEGTHALSGDLEGVSVVVDANGIIVEIIDERATEENASAFQIVDEQIPAVLEGVSEIIATEFEVEMDRAFDVASLIVNRINEITTTEEEVVVVEEQAMSKINAKLESFATSIEAVAEMMKIIANQNNDLSKEVATLKGEFETFKSAPINKTSEGEKFAKVGNLTAKQIWLKNNKNK